MGRRGDREQELRAPFPPRAHRRRRGEIRRARQERHRGHLRHAAQPLGGALVPRSFRLAARLRVAAGGGADGDGAQPRGDRALRMEPLHVQPEAQGAAAPHPHPHAVPVGRARRLRAARLRPELLRGRSRSEIRGDRRSGPFPAYGAARSRGAARDRVRAGAAGSAGVNIVNFDRKEEGGKMKANRRLRVALLVLFVSFGVLSGCGNGGGGGGGAPEPTFWNSRSSGTNNTLFGIGIFSGQAVVVGALGTVLTSMDGITWTTRSSGISFHLNGVAASGNKAIAVGDNGTIVSSPDLAAWTPQSSGTTNTLRAVA